MFYGWKWLVSVISIQVCECWFDSKLYLRDMLLLPRSYRKSCTGATRACWEQWHWRRASSWRSPEWQSRCANPNILTTTILILRWVTLVLHCRGFARFEDYVEKRHGGWSRSLPVFHTYTRGTSVLDAPGKYLFGLAFEEAAAKWRRPCPVKKYVR